MGKSGPILGLVGAVLLIVAILGTWWTYSLAASAFGQTVTGHGDFGLFGGQVTTATPAGTTSLPVNYSDSRNVASTFQLTSMFLFLGILLGVLMAVLGVASWRRPNLRKIAGVLGVLAFALALLAPLYLMSALPGALNSDSGSGSTDLFEVTGFWGSRTTTFFGASATAAWGAGWAWYVALIGGILLLVGAVLTIRSPNPAMMPGYPPAPGYPPYAPPQQPPPPPP